MVEGDLSEAEFLNKKWEKISARLGLNKKEEERSVFVFNKRRFIVVSIAASVIWLLVIGSFTYTLFLNTNKSINTNNNLAVYTTISTNEGERANIILPDSSRVIINSGSLLSYSTDYNSNERIVHFEGEAFFDIRTNRDKPFVVKLDDATITATGTKFNVLSYKEDNRIETTLEEGKVHVSTRNNDNLELRPGQQAVFFRQTEEAVIHNVVTETFTSWKENKLRLIETPMEEALKKIERRYNVNFEVIDTSILELKYTATFIDETVDEIMQILEGVSPIRYKIYNQTTAGDKKYTGPKIIVSKK